MGDVEQHHRRSIRLNGYDYTRDGAYLVTICTQDRVRLFGTVVNGYMQMNEYGREVANCWMWLAERYSYVHLDQWIVMPDHIHGIVVVADRTGGAGRGGAGRGGAGRGGLRTAPTSTKRKTLERLIGAFKTVSTKCINDVGSTPGAKVWQRNYYEQIVRDGLQLHRARRHIANIPSRWELDRENRV